MNVSIGLAELVIVVLGFALVLKLIRGRRGGIAAGLFLLFVFGLIAAALLPTRQRVANRHHVQLATRLAHVEELRKAEALDRAEAQLKKGIERVHAAQQRVSRSRAVVIQMSQDQENAVELQYHDPFTPIPLSEERPATPETPLAPETPPAPETPLAPETPPAPAAAPASPVPVVSAKIVAEIDSDRQLIHGPAAWPITVEVEGALVEVVNEALDDAMGSDDAIGSVEPSEPIMSGLRTESVPDAGSSDRLATGEATPDWVDLLDYEWDNRVYRTTITVGPFQTHEEVESRLHDELTQAKDKFVAWYRKQTGGSEDAWYDRFPFQCSAKSLERECVRDKFETETPVYAGENWPVTHALVEFDGKFQRRVDIHLEQMRSLARTGQTGLGAVAFVGLLATLFGYLKFDQVTSHQCRGRLRLAALGTLGALAGGIALLAGWLP